MLGTTSERSRLLARLHAARAETDALFALVRREFLFERPISERHRLAFYIGHLEAFDWNLLSAPLRLTSARADLDRLFAFGIDPVDGNLPSDQPSDWPPLEVFFRYRDEVRAQLDDALMADAAAAIDRLLHVAIEHREMHAETLSYLLHQLPFAMKQGRGQRAAPSTPPAPETVRIPAGNARLGLASSSGEFGWDNEFEAHTVDVPAFAIDRYKVTNAQFLAFVEADGYARREFWSDDDWAWKQDHNVRHPAFWIANDDAHDGADPWLWRGMFEAFPLPPEWPVYVSHAEASAYARWAGRSLPSEAQWQRAAFGDGGAPVEDGELAVRFDPRAVDDAALIEPGPFGVTGMRGNGWEWTSSVFAPFAGFEIFDFYPGYSAPFFDGKHFVLKGGSVRTAPSMLRPSFRNWFQAHYPYVYAGFRCVDRSKERRS
ncbi:MAG TPA: SUMF1/EgtB/PvdO family nonheme iron enzyme [Rudaea sp.]